jgi:hypothetical protein
MPLKGGALLAAGIVRPWARHLDDLDLWVSPAQGRLAWDLLVAAGFVPVDRVRSTTHAGIDSLDAPTHQLPLLRSPEGTLIEIHLQSHATGAAGDFDACWAAAVDVDVHNVSVRVPSPLHLLEQLCAHVVFHHFGDLRYWPRHVEDVRALLAHSPALVALRTRPDEVGLSLRVLHGVDDPHCVDAWLAQCFLSPSPATAATWRALALAARTVRLAADGPRAFLHVLVPTASHLRFTGDLAGGRGLAAARVHRWRRLARRLRAP